MRKRNRSTSGAALMEIALLAPAVMAARTQAMMLGASGAKSRRELTRMVSEKPLAAAEAMAGAQRAMMKKGLDVWTGATKVSGLFWFDLAEEMLSASLIPISRRVRGNSRRLTGR